MSSPRDDDRRNDRGSVMVVAALALVALVLFAALAVDVGFVWSSRTQSQNVSDSAAIAAAQTMIVPKDPTHPTIDLEFDKDDSVKAGTDYASFNSTVANPSATVRPGDFKFGNWNLQTRKLEPADESDPDQMTGVRVDVVMDGTVNRTSPGLLSRILQTSDGSRPYLNGFEVKNTSVAYLGFQKGFDDFFDLPVALDSCELVEDDESGDKCGKNFCKKTEEAAACEFEKPGQKETQGVICGEMSNTGDQNMCFTNLNDDSSSVNAADLKKMIQTGSTPDGNAGDEIYLDNGEKASVLAEIRDKFYGCGKYAKPAGSFIDPDDGKEKSDRYGTGRPDSWVVKLPVVECQDTQKCAKGDPALVLGGACFEIREVVASSPGGKSCPDPDAEVLKGEWIKGRALCPNSKDDKVKKLYEKYCKKDDDDSVDPGGCNFGFRANRVVLVE